MGTIINDGMSNGIFTIIMIIGGVLILGAILAATASKSAEQKAQLATPCSQYQQLPISEVPARCISQFDKGRQL